MASNALICSRCGARAAPGQRYCATCGEAVDPALVAELTMLYHRIRALDEVIAAGDGDRVVRELRADYTTRYLAQRSAPKTTPFPTPSPAPAPVAAAWAGALAASGIPPVTSAAPPVSAPPVAPVAPQGPVFSWRAFLAEQAIAIMAYLGGFLLLVATLSFEVGAWQVFNDTIKLAVICAVYLAFGVLGFVLRNSERLRTVGRAYLGVFALMTPLVALAAYLFTLRGLGFPVAGMLCVSAAYAAAIYLILAWRTAFATYAYLGWTALVIAALAIVPWTSANGTWQLFALAIAALLLLVPTLARTARMPALFVDPALHIATLASVVALLGTLFCELLLLTTNPAVAQYASLPPIAAVAASAVALVPLGLAWSLVPRRRPLAFAGPALLDALDVAVAALAPQAAVAVAAWLNADTGQVAMLLGGLGLAECAAAAVFRWRSPLRSGARYAIESLALLLAIIGAWIVWRDAAPNVPLIVALSAGVLVAAGITALERAPWFSLTTGVLLSLDFYAILFAILASSAAPLTPESLAKALVIVSTSVAAFTLLLWVAALALGSNARLRVYALPVYIVALGNALYTLRFLQNLPYANATVILAAFTLAALVAGWRLRQPLAGNLVTAFFGMLAVVPYAYQPHLYYDKDSIALSVTMVVAALAALAIRWLLGRTWALGAYAIALWTALLGSYTFTHFSFTHETWSLLGIPLVAWPVLAVAALGVLVALWEAHPAVLAAPALFLLIAALRTDQPVAAFALVLVPIATGAALRWWRGRWWNVALFAAAALASWHTVATLSQLQTNARNWQVAELLAFAVIAYLLAAQERVAWTSAFAFVYATGATALLPGSDNLVPTLVFVFGAAALGVVVRLRIGRAWALVFYAVAAQATLFAVLRVPHASAGVIEALLLVFAAVAYGIAVLEAEPLAGVAPLLYASAAALVQHDAQALLPLALALAVVGFVLGRVGGPRWSWPAYAAAALAAGLTALLGTPEPGFEALALLALAVAAYLIAALESRADALPLALLLGLLALTAGISALGWSEWMGVLAYAALSWIYYLGAQLWQRLPGLHPRSAAWWTLFDPQRLYADRWREPRWLGAQIHFWAGLVAGAGTCVAALLAPYAFAPHTAPTLAAVLALLSLAGLFALAGVFALFKLQPGLWVGLYVAGELLALAITWAARWLGADNVQAYVLVPGSYQILIGALMPGDTRLGRLAHAGRWFSLLGAALLLLPTLGQSFQSDPNWLYALILAFEALALAAVGVGTRSRLLVLIGSAFVGVAALRGAALAVNSGIPVPLVIGGLALLLMGGATWLSLRVRHETSQTTP